MAAINIIRNKNEKEANFKCELLTKLHGHEFSNGYLQTGMIDQCDYFRVLDYSARTAMEEKV